MLSPTMKQLVTKMLNKFSFLTLVPILLRFLGQCAAQMTCENVNSLNTTETNIFGQWFAVEVSASDALPPSRTNLSCSELTIDAQNFTHLVANIFYSDAQNDLLNVSFTGEEVVSDNADAAYGYNFSYTSSDGISNVVTTKIVNVTGNFVLLCGFEPLNSSNSFGVILSREINYNQSELVAMENNSDSQFTFANGFSHINQNLSDCERLSVPPNCGHHMIPGCFLGVLIVLFSIFNFFKL